MFVRGIVDQKSPLAPALLRSVTKQGHKTPSFYVGTKEKVSKVQKTKNKEQKTKEKERGESDITKKRRGEGKEINIINRNLCSVGDSQKCRTPSRGFLQLTLLRSIRL